MNPKYLSSDDIKVLLSLLRVYGVEGRATVRQVSELADRSVACTHKSLKLLRRHGMVTWEDNKSGTLRPEMEVVK